MIVTIRYVKTVVMDTETNEIISFVETAETEKGCVVELGTKPTKKQKVKKEVVDNGKLINKDNKLVLTPSIIEKLNAEVGDRIAINYVQQDSDFVPVISKSSVFGDAESGNKLTKALTVSFRGKQSENLSQYGNEFDLVEDNSLAKGVYLLVDQNHIKIETIKEDELISIEKIEETVPESLDLNIGEEDLKESENNINFDFDFENV